MDCVCICPTCARRDCEHEEAPVLGYEFEPGQHVFIDAMGGRELIEKLRESCDSRREYERRLAVMVDLYIGGAAAVDALRECLKDGPLQGCSG